VDGVANEQMNLRITKAAIVPTRTPPVIYNNPWSRLPIVKHHLELRLRYVGAEEGPRQELMLFPVVYIGASPEQDQHFTSERKFVIGDSQRLQGFGIGSVCHPDFPVSEMSL